jgi:CheY-like chemotaxis protein
MAPASASSPARPDKQVLALVVERNPIVQRLEQFFLEQAGYDVEFASDGASAFARARELHPAILVTEILVPKIDGLTLCRNLKSHPETKDILVLVFSHLEAGERAREAGADAFLQKPLGEVPLLETLRKLVARHHEILGEKK